MSHTFAGIDPFTAPAYLSGYGEWLDGTSPDDNDKRTAALAAVAAEAALNRTNWLAWRTINIVDGGTYTFTAPVSVRNAWSFTGTALFSSTVLFQGIATFSANVIISGTNNLTVGGNLTVLGYQKKRITVLGDADVTIDPVSDADEYEIPAAGAADRTITLGTSGADDVVVTFRRGKPTGTLRQWHITDGITAFGGFASAAARSSSISYVKRSGTWRVHSYSGDPSVDVSILT